MEAQVSCLLLWGLISIHLSWHVRFWGRNLTHSFMQWIYLRHQFRATFCAGCWWYRTKKGIVLAFKEIIIYWNHISKQLVTVEEVSALHGSKMAMTVLDLFLFKKLLYVPSTQKVPSGPLPIMNLTPKGNRGQPLANKSWFKNKTKQNTYMAICMCQALS